MSELKCEPEFMHSFGPLDHAFGCALKEDDGDDDIKISATHDEIPAQLKVKLKEIIIG